MSFRDLKIKKDKEMVKSTFKRENRDLFRQGYRHIEFLFQSMNSRIFGM